jgi:beta-galactosidase/beta-glucuronidase
LASCDTGIHRSVELIRRPLGADIIDYQVQADASGHITCHIECRRPIVVIRRSQQQRIVVRLYDDEQLTADGDVWKEGKCIWTASHMLEAEHGDNNFLVSVNVSGDIGGADLRLWSAETPHLYTLTVSLETTATDTSAETTRTVQQAESCRVGFRTIDIHDGTVHVNGKRITVCGMNRHEHDPDHGKVVSLERMKQDICLLKYVNIEISI